MKISISEIENLDEKLLNIEFSEIIEEFNKTKPILANILVASLGNDYVNVSGTITAELQLTCDSCLKEFEKKLTIKVDETFAKNTLFDEYKEEIELKEGSFIEDLNGEDEIDITDLIYQSVILNLPNKLVCDINCIGDEKIEQYIKKETSDPRLDIFKSIKIEKDI